MDQSAAFAVVPSTVVFRDGFGERARSKQPGTGEALEALRLRRDLTDVPSFEFALRERAGRLASFRHTCFGRVRTVDRLRDPSPSLTLISEATPGMRLSDLLTAADRRALTLDRNIVGYLTRQLVSAVAMLHANTNGIAHGAISPERIVITPNARLVLVEHVMGGAIEELRYTPERYWTELRVACPTSREWVLRFDAPSDVLQIGLVALALVLGRPLRAHEYPSEVEHLVSRAGDLRPWLLRALQIDTRQAFSSAMQAQTELVKIVADSDYIAASTSLEAFIAHEESRQGEADDPRPPVPPAFDRSPAPAPVARTASGGQPVLPTSRAASGGHPVLPTRTASGGHPVVMTPPVSTSRAASGAHTVAEEIRSPFAKTEPLPGSVEPTPYEKSVHEAPEEPEFVEPEPRQKAFFLAGRRDWKRTAAVAGVAVVVLAGTGLAARRWTTSRGAAETTIVPAPPPPVASVLALLPVANGQLQVRTEPPGAKVTVDGQMRGVSPITVDSLSPGEHVVQLDGAGASNKQLVTIQRGAATSVNVRLSNAPAVADVAAAQGWIAVSAPSEVQLFEGGRLLGSSLAERLALSPGSHQLEIANDELGFRIKRTVMVVAEKVSTVAVEFPMASMAVNAIPWADVWIDGERVGQTPIANVPVTIGSHEVVFRHPELGEVRRVTIVTLNAPARLSVDLRP